MMWEINKGVLDVHWPPGGNKVIALHLNLSADESSLGGEKYIAAHERFMGNLTWFSLGLSFLQQSVMSNEGASKEYFFTTDCSTVVAVANLKFLFSGPNGNTKSVSVSLNVSAGMSFSVESYDES